MTNDDRLIQFIDRILSLREESDEVNSRVREAYKEAKDEGFDKTALGALVSELRKVAKDPEKAASASDMLSLYREAYDRSKGRAHTGARANIVDWSEVKAAANGEGH